ncbi:hypothetical protein L6452_08071 [Arctium lappa]|uniref:Uncharacterized protein n=1 Tax=Arctium lappa TaxID=4217 RepID=A0ACB9DGJ9_ARCLA|nr:hypothetical protein L6452_08071 [Arctium lappa]
MDTGLQQGWAQVFSKDGHRSSTRYKVQDVPFVLRCFGLKYKYNVLEGDLQASSAPEDMRTSSASRERSSAAEGLRDLRIFPKMLRRLSSIRFERCTPTLSSSADLRLHRTFVKKPSC